jgi:hypothetical protein
VVGKSGARRGLGTPIERSREVLEGATKWRASSHFRVSELRLGGGGEAAPMVEQAAKVGGGSARSPDGDGSDIDSTRRFE